jgi:hypothetical protein
MMKVTVDGITVEIPNGSSVLQAREAAGGRVMAMPAFVRHQPPHTLAGLVPATHAALHHRPGRASTVPSRCHQRQANRVDGRDKPGQGDSLGAPNRNLPS